MQYSARRLFSVDHEGDRTVNTPSADTIIMLEALKAAVAKALDRKKRLGQYAVFWSDSGPVMVGEDAPKDRTSSR